MKNKASIKRQPTSTSTVWAKSIHRAQSQHIHLSSNTHTHTHLQIMYHYHIWNRVNIGSCGLHRLASSRCVYFVYEQPNIFSLFCCCCFFFFFSFKQEEPKKSNKLVSLYMYFFFFFIFTFFFSTVRFLYAFLIHVWYYYKANISRIIRLFLW